MSIALFGSLAKHQHKKEPPERVLAVGGGTSGVLNLDVLDKAELRRDPGKVSRLDPITAIPDLRRVGRAVAQQIDLDACSGLA